ncbi:ankyrin repeat domain-containing protein, partial [Spirochaetota bacterium]
IIATENGDINIIKLLIEKGINVNAKGGNGRTALITASEKGYTEIVKILISNKANIETRDNSGFSAYMTAILNGNISIVLILKKNGAVLTRNDKKKIASSINIRKTTEKIINSGKEKIKKLFDEIVKEGSK